MEPACHHRWDELGGQALHDFVGRRDPGDVLLARGTFKLGGYKASRDDRCARMGQHAEGVPLSARKHHLSIDESGTGPGQHGSIDQHGGHATPTVLFFAHQLQRLSCLWHF